MNKQQLHEQLASLDGWELNEARTEISRAFKFQDFYQTMSFVNAVAKIAHAHDHHPDMKIGYNYCHITYTTHSENGLTDKDIRCASEIDQLPAQNN